MACEATDGLRRARDFLFSCRADYDLARRDFSWPALADFNFALDWFDVIARERDREALCVVSEDGGVVSRSFSDLTASSNRVANFLRDAGVKRGDAVLLMMGNVVPLWETMLALMKLGAVMIPTAPLLSRVDLAERIAQGDVRYVVADHRHAAKFSAGDWIGVSVFRGGWFGCLCDRY